jgi:hypothetical protein
MPFGKKPFSRVVTGVDKSRLFYARLVGRLNAAGAEITTATMQAVTASNYIEFLLNGAGDSDINDYTGTAGAAGRITITDANADTVGDVIDIINGVGVGQDGGVSAGGSRRWRAALGDFPRAYALTSGDLLNQASAVEMMLGKRHKGASVFADSSGLASPGPNDIWVGIGTEHGVLAGGGLVVPDYFEDVPGETTTSTKISSPSGDRTRQKAKRNDESGIAARYSVVIHAILTGVDWDTTKLIEVYTEDQVPGTDTPFYSESIAATGAGSTVYNGAAGGPVLVGPPGKALFVRVSGTSNLTDGNVVVTGYYEQTPRSAVAA